MEFIDDRGLADAGVAGNKNKLRPTAGYNTVEGGKQGADFRFSAVQSLWNQQPVWRILFAKREFVNAMLRFPFIQAAPKIACSASRCLVSLLGGFGEQLHDYRRYRSRSTREPVYSRHRLPPAVGAHEFSRILNGQ